MTRRRPPPAPVLAADGSLAACVHEGEAILLDGGGSRTLDLEGVVEGVALSADGAWAAAWVDDDVVLVTTATGEVASRTPLPRPGRAVVLGNDGRALVLLGDDRGPILCAIHDGMPEPVDAQALDGFDPEGVVADAALSRVLLLARGGANPPALALSLEGAHAEVLQAVDVPADVQGVVMLGEHLGVARRDGLRVAGWPAGDTVLERAWSDMESVAASPNGSHLTWWWHTWDGEQAGVGVRAGRIEDGAVTLDARLDVPGPLGGEVSALAVDDAGVVTVAWGAQPDRVGVVRIDAQGESRLVDLGLDARTG